MKADKLTTDRGCIFSDLQGCLIGIVQPSFQKLPASAMIPASSDVQFLRGEGSFL